MSAPYARLLLFYKFSCVHNPVIDVDAERHVIKETILWLIPRARQPLKLTMNKVNLAHFLQIRGCQKVSQVRHPSPGLIQ